MLTAILRIDGDTGVPADSFDASRGEYRVSHFEAAGAALYSLKPQSDEAPFLVDLHRRYHASGLEIVDISFEEEELKNPERLRAFIAKYQIPLSRVAGWDAGSTERKDSAGKES